MCEALTDVFTQVDPRDTITVNNGTRKSDGAKLGSGLAENARLSISGRQRQIDDVVESANTGLAIPRN